MKTSAFLLTAVLVVVLSGCTNNSIPADWVEYRSAALGISFMHPPEYQNAEAEPAVLFLQTGSIIVQRVFLRQARPISPFIIITRSSDPKILAEAARYHPLERRTINGQPVWFYRVDGYANPEGYVFYDGAGWILLEFLGSIDDSPFDQISRSVRMGPTVWEE